MANPPRNDTLPGPLWICLAGALSLAAAMGIGRFAFTPMLPLMIRGGVLDVAAGGWIAAANYAGYLVGAFTAARLPLPAARLALVALALTALLTAAMALPGPPALWMALRFAGGVASAWTFVATSAWCLSALARAGRPHWSGAVYAGVGGGIALAGAYCLVGAGAGASAPSLWVQLGALVVLFAVPVAMVLRRMPRAAVPPAPAAAAATTGARGAAAALPPGTRGVVWCYAVLGFGYILPATFLPVLARSVVDDPRLFGLAWPVFGATAVASTFFAAWWMRRASRLTVWAVSNLFMGAGVLLPSLWLSGLTVALSALFVGGTFMIVTMAGVQEIRARASGDPTPLLGRMTTAFAAGQIAGPVLSTLLVLWRGAGHDGLNLALQAGALSLLASAAWLWRLSLATTNAKGLSDASA